VDVESGSFNLLPLLVQCLTKTTLHSPYITSEYLRLIASPEAVFFGRAVESLSLPYLEKESNGRWAEMSEANGRKTCSRVGADLIEGVSLRALVHRIKIDIPMLKPTSTYLECQLG